MYESAPAASPGAIIADVPLLLRAGGWDSVTPASAGWRYLSFHVARVAGVEEHATGGEEMALVLLEGACAVEADGERLELGPRAACSSGMPWALYLPRDTVYRVEGEAEARGRGARARRGSRPCS